MLGNQLIVYGWYIYISVHIHVYSNMSSGDTLQWEDTLWPGETCSEPMPIFTMLTNLQWTGHTIEVTPEPRFHCNMCSKSVPTWQVSPRHRYISMLKVYFGSQKMQFRHPNLDILVSPRHRFYCMHFVWFSESHRVTCDEAGIQRRVVINPPHMENHTKCIFSLTLHSQLFSIWGKVRSMREEPWMILLLHVIFWAQLPPPPLPPSNSMYVPYY